MNVLALAAWLLLAPPAQVRIAQALPSDEPVTVTVMDGGRAVTAVEGLCGGQLAAYADVPASKLNVLLQAGEREASGDIDLSAGGKYTVVLHRFLGEPLLLLRDDVPALAADQTAVRFVQVVPDQDELWLRWRRPHGTEWRDEPAFEKLAFLAAGSYQVVPSGPVTLGLKVPDEEGGEPVSVTDFTGLRLLPGTVLTVVVCGLSATEGEHDLPLTLLAMIDAVTGPEG